MANSFLRKMRLYEAQILNGGADAQPVVSFPDHKRLLRSMYVSADEAIVGEIIQIDWFNLFILAMLAATATVGIKSGSLAPLFPGITRRHTPKRYWFGIAISFGLVTLNVVRLLFLLRG